MFRLDKYRAERGGVRSSPSLLQSFSKRGFDMIAASASLLLLSPLILVISLGIKIDSSGPILCRNKRYNSNNIEFDTFEFRTTFVDQREKTLNRKRDDMQFATGFGQILCRSGLNKLPILINVLKGEMSIVGSHLFADAPGKSFAPLDLHEVRPGLVSWAHVNDDHGENVDAAKNVHHCVKCDRYYVDNRSFAFDVKIILRVIFLKMTYS